MTSLDFLEHGSRLKRIPSSGYYKIFQKEILCDCVPGRKRFDSRTANCSTYHDPVTFTVIINDNSACAFTLLGDYMFCFINSFTNPKSTK